MGCVYPLKRHKTGAYFGFSQVLYYIHKQVFPLRFSPDCTVNGTKFLYHACFWKKTCGMATYSAIFYVRETTFAANITSRTNPERIPKASYSNIQLFLPIWG